MNDLYAEPIQKRNTGAFRKGLTPYNKGKKGTCSRTDDFIVKGTQGFLPRPVVCINPDGSIHQRFASVKEAAKATGVKDHHSIGKACQGKFRCRGYKWMYEDEYIPWADLHYKPREGRDIYGRLLPGNKLRCGARETMSEEAKQRHDAISRANALRMVADPNNRFGKSTRKVAVTCADTGESFATIKEAGAHFHIAPSLISGAISRGGTAHGLKFYVNTKK